MAEFKNETEHWEVITSPSEAPGYSKTYEEAMDYVEKLRELGDPGFVPTHLLRVTEITERQEQMIALAEPAGITVEDVFPLLREALIKLGGQPPQGEDALHWAVKKTLEVHHDLTAK